jgi:hypothetical protein
MDGWPVIGRDDETPRALLSFSLFLLLDEPQPRKANGGDHHHDQYGVIYHRSCPELMFTDQDCSSASEGSYLAASSTMFLMSRFQSNGGLSGSSRCRQTGK